MKDFKKPRSFGPKKSFGPRSKYGPPRGGSSFGARPFDPTVERFQAICNECHQSCEVPFKPNGKKPVYCRNCFKGKEDAPAFGGIRESRRETAVPTADFSKQFDALNAKLDHLIKVIEMQGKA